MVIWLRALAALGLLAGLYLMTVVLVALDLVLVGGSLANFFAHWGERYNQFPTGILVVLAGATPFCWMVLWVVLTASQRTGETWRESVRVSRDDAPDLWDIVDELARRVGTRPPAELRLVATADAAVTEETRFLGLVAGTRRMYIGLPLLVGLSVGELRAILSHELGHYARRHTRTGAIAYRGAVSLNQAIDRMERMGDESSRTYLPLYAGIVAFCFIRYARLYSRVSAAVRRRQELEADAAAADVAGTKVTAEALRSAHALPAAWNDFRTRYVEPMRKAGCVPDDPFSVFQAMLRDPGYQRELAYYKKCPPQPSPTRFDSHPSLDQRLRLLDQRREPPEDPPGLEPDRTPAIDLLPSGRAPAAGDGPPELIASVRLVMFPLPDSPPSLPSQEWTELAATFHATAPAKQLAQAVRRIRVRFALPKATLAAALELLESGHGTRLATALASLVPAQEETKDAHGADEDELRLAESLVALIGHALVTAGRASWQISWTGRLGRLEATDTTELQIHRLVTAALSGRPTEVARLRLHLNSLGVDTPALLDLDARTTETSAPASSTVPVLPTARSARLRKLWQLVPVLILWAFFFVISQAEISAKPPDSTPYVPNPRPSFLYHSPTYPSYRFPGDLPTPSYRLPDHIPTIPSYQDYLLELKPTPRLTIARENR